ncbi:hypothetical protein FJY71_06840 [candidate division WOR-3 bacterium]|nr:hypothetical protein [candidate division WOR-3 bacterium]
MKHAGRPRRRATMVLVVFALVAAAFLPGPNGLVSVLARAVRVRRLRADIPRLEARIDSLERVCRYLSDPVCAGEFAARRLAPLTADSTPRLPAPR